MSFAAAGPPASHGGQVCERSLTESDYQRHWEELSFPREFTTLAGARITVLDGGVHNRNAGPDFLNALILTEQDVIQGAVEIHLQQEGWWMHGHESDRRYRGVVLHVVGSQERSANPRRDQHYPAHTILLTGVAKQTSGTAGRRRCGHLEPVEWSDRLLEDLGWQRIRRKASRVGELRKKYSQEDLWYTKVLRCLGYGHNHRQMERVADVVPFSLAREIAAHFSAKHLFEFLLGFLGYDEYYGCPAPAWEQMASDFQLRGFRYYHWHPLSSRPANHPLFRLYLFLSVFERWYALSRPGYQRFSARECVEGLQVRKPVPARYAGLFGQQTISIGKVQAVELVLNCLVPLWLHEDADARPTLRRWAQDLPGIPPYQKIVRFIRGTRWPHSYSEGTIQPLRLQGFLHLREHWCNEERCQECPVMPSLHGRK